MTKEDVDLVKNYLNAKYSFKGDHYKETQALRLCQEIAGVVGIAWKPYFDILWTNRFLIVKAAERLVSK